MSKPPFRLNKTALGLVLLINILGTINMRRSPNNECVGDPQTKWPIGVGSAWAIDLFRQVEIDWSQFQNV